MSKGPARTSPADGQIVALVKGNDLPFTVLHIDGITVDSIHRNLEGAQFAAFHLLTTSGAALVRTPEGETHTYTRTVKKRFNFFPAERQAV